MKYEIGDRIGAIQSADDTTVKLFGYGVYKGRQMSPQGFDNPMLELDDGTIVWGYQCWWGPEEKIKQMCVGRSVERVKV